MYCPKLAHPKILKGSKSVKTSKQYHNLRVSLSLSINIYRLNLAVSQIN